MRLWSIHPSYLDARGLVALWREALLAQKVLQGKTFGYTQHPQLIRFRNTANPEGAIAMYLKSIAMDADNRGYHFDKSKIARKRTRQIIRVTKGQLEYELCHLLKKLKTRDKKQYSILRDVNKPKSHPLFKVINGDIEPWEIV